MPTVITPTTCKGLGAAHQGKFNTFRCKATYLDGQKTATVWVRARPGGQFCAASTGLDACPVAAPTIGDPRVCNKAPAPPTADPNSCALGSAILALNRAMGVKFAPPGDPLPHDAQLELHRQEPEMALRVQHFGQDRTVHPADIVFTQGTAAPGRRT